MGKNGRRRTGVENAKKIFAELLFLFLQPSAEEKMGPLEVPQALGRTAVPLASISQNPENLLAATKLASPTYSSIPSATHHGGLLAGLQRSKYPELDQFLGDIFRLSFFFFLNI